MIQIDVDREVFEKLGTIAIPFVETTPNMVIRRLLGLSVQAETNNGEKLFIPLGEEKMSNKNNQVINRSLDSNSPSSSDFKIRIDNLRRASSQTHPAFLTFLMDKYQNTKGNYKTSDIMDFMNKTNLSYSNKIFRNPWMAENYGGEKNGLISCQRTIEHFRQTRKYGCWGGKDDKSLCEEYQCQYHPRNNTPLRNKCDLRNGVIWKRSDPNSLFSYGANYLRTIKRDLLNNKMIPLKSLLEVFYPDKDFNGQLIELFAKDFHLSDEEMGTLFSQ